ncbi:uncharacterized protein LOC115332038 [Ixodes scapularis]|uniref:uncharacterized protein LOC115320087 n=2 Tax=Ixodes scapularis TaxID=6945 RepID=UPI001AD70A05|nr:uncharacterized protein LOC115320087 [Ixodes scapularis]XP_042144272.1 uncharacterized protein LOC115332038 [Ixodes scapularis]
MAKFPQLLLQVMPILLETPSNTPFTVPEDSIGQQQVIIRPHWLDFHRGRETSSTTPLQKQGPDPANIRGLGTHPTASMAKFPQLLLQVGLQYKQHSYKNSYKFVVIVPCPQKCFAILCDCWRRLMLLLLSGDVESNPGPLTIEQKLEKILENQGQMSKDLQEVKSGQANLRQEMHNIHGKINKLENAMSNIQSEMVKVDSLKEVVANLEQTVRQQSEKLIDLENRGRRNNLLIFGLPEKHNESTEELKRTVTKDVFLETLGITVTSIERIHRLGRKREETNRPVIIKFFDYNEIEEIFKNCRKLKGTKLSISSDYAKETVQVRKLLWGSAASNRAKGDKVSLVHDKLKINGETFVWDLNLNQRRRVQPSGAAYN